MAVEGKDWREKKKGFYTTSIMTVVYIVDRINGEGLYIYLKSSVFIIKLEIN